MIINEVGSGCHYRAGDDQKCTEIDTVWLAGSDRRSQLVYIWRTCSICAEILINQKPHPDSIYWSFRMISDDEVTCTEVLES